MELVALYKRLIGVDVHQAQTTACALTRKPHLRVPSALRAPAAGSLHVTLTRSLQCKTHLTFAQSRGK